MKTLRVDFRHFWPSFEPEHFVRGFSYLAPRVRIVHDAERPELLVVSCFVDGTRATAPPVVDEGLPRLFFTAENVRPDFAACEWALSFCRDLDDDRHLRLPNYVFAQHVLGFESDALVRPANDDPAAFLAAKTRFCTFLQRNDVPFRNEFVERLARYKPVDCAGPCLNNTGFTVTRAEKHAYLAESKFTIAFENEAAPGYTTEKLGDALLARSVPIYWGDPTVALDFNPEAFLDLRDFRGMDELVERVIALDRDDALYAELLAAPPYSDNRLPPHADPERIADFFERVADACAAARVHPTGGRGRVAGIAGKPDAAYVPGPLGFHGDRHLLRLVQRLLPTVDVFVETGTNVGTTLRWVATQFPHLECLSCEPDPKAVAIAREHAGARPGVEIFAESSQDFIRRLGRERPALFERTPLFWLDAHGYGFEWPLLDEVAFALTRFASGFLMIDDFRVPGVDAFGYDAYDNKACSFEYIESALPPGVEYDLYYPAYTERTSSFHPLRGWGLIAFGPTPRPDLERELPGIVRRHVGTLSEARLEAAEQAFRAGDLAHAEALVRRVLVDAPGTARAWNDLGACLATGGRAEEAMLAFAQALRVDNYDPTALANLLDLVEASASTSDARVAG